MEFTVAVGTEETHDVHLRFDRWFGKLRIDVDGQDVAGDWRPFTLHRTRRYEIPIGTDEPHDVVIEKTRKLWLGGLRDQSCRVLVDGELVGTYVGTPSGSTSRV